MIQPRGFQFSNLLLFVIHICFFRLIGLMNLERETTFPPYEGDLSNQHLSFDQDQWKTNSQMVRVFPLSSILWKTLLLLPIA